jgi:hypothetical protein
VVEAGERGRHERGHPVAERGPDQCHNVGGAEPGGPGAVQAHGQEGRASRGGGQARHPPDSTESEGALDRGQEGHEQDHAGDRCALNRPHGTSVSRSTQDATGPWTSQAPAHKDA